jgi:hypothetical protein
VSNAVIPLLLLGAILQGVGLSLAEHGQIIGAGVLVVSGATLVWFSGFLGGADIRTVDRSKGRLKV